ncbi:hypothetical protein CAPTEDRAFT_172928 [Capitella teleta]|uniref:Major facilitator superfamily (MFS) profile domain-containing protein n=1 Tax=Capitella teleta TaxID=283909 RepID=R7UUG1_CAPTE|nr:hypothetical protein CAPTEDRAFT_172928 [Capitella teleta]|eukprot:ELU09830.1 hypothetical protein CAPTEDRAFT_172928 [Capitella teleta]
MADNRQNEREPLLRRAYENEPLPDPLARARYQAYKVRWFMLFVLSLLNASNGMIWISFSPIADMTSKYFHITTMQVNWLAIIYMVINIPLGIVAMWCLDGLGLRVSLILASWINFVGSGLRIISCMNLDENFRYPLLLTGQGITACAQPLIMFATTKLAALWFPVNERALANSIGSMANPIGILLGNIIAPLVVTNPDRIKLLMDIFTVPAGVGVVFTTFGIWNSVPPTPPNASAAEMSEPFWSGVKKVCFFFSHQHDLTVVLLQACKTKSFLILMLSYGGGFAIVTTLITLLEQLICPHGYSDTFAGICGALMFGVGLLGAGGAALIVDKTKKFEETAKIGLSVSTIFLLAFLVVSRQPNQEILLAVLLALVGFFGFAIVPVCLELGVECTYPVAEATSAGFIIISGQIQALLYTIMIPALAPTLSRSELPEQTCSSPSGINLPQDYTVPNMVFSGIAAFLALAFTIFFRCEYKRLRAEEEILAERLLNLSREHTLSINA